MLAHELGHVKHRDTLTMTITAVMAGAISMLANMAFFMGGGRDRNNPLGFVGMMLVMMLAPIAAMLVQAAISRSREFEADKAGAEITGPAAMAGQRAGPDRARRRSASTIIPPTPIPPRRTCSSSIRCMAGCQGLFATHPSTEERIARLRAMAGGAAVPVRKGPWG